MATILPPGDPGRLRPAEVLVDGVRSTLLEGGPPRMEEAIVFVHGNPGSSSRSCASSQRALRHPLVRVRAGQARRVHPDRPVRGPDGSP